MQSQLGIAVRRAFHRALHPDTALGVLVACVVAMMVVPLPTGLLDVLIASNLALSVLLLLVALSVRDGLSFTAMPTLLLMTTLYRLALNVSSTRLILLQADAGDIIAAFGDFVVRGDYAVGAAVFLVLTIVQYVVVARGAERVAEVGARFSLDALPGKQMAIDADLRSGALSQARARERRQTLEQESRFYGAMDGAMKFVKGDAIAGIAIAFVSFSAGSAIGALRDGLPLAESLRLYGLLTIGDALVSQIPSLLVATSAGLVVTRVASNDDESSLGGDLGQQLLGNPRVLWTGAALFAALMLVPGLPGAPFGALAGALALIGLQAQSRASKRGGGAPASIDPSEPLGVELGPELAKDVSAVESALAAVAERAHRTLGIPLPAITTRVRNELGARDFRVVVSGAVADRGSAPPGGTAVAITALLERAVQRHAAILLGVDETQALLDGAAKRTPMLVQHVVPETLSLRALTQLLQRLLAEGVRLQPLRPVLEAIATEGTKTTDGNALIERVRARLGRQITERHAPAGTLAAHAIDPMIEEALRDAVQGSGESAYLALPPDLATEIVNSIRTALARTGQRDAAPAVLLTQPDVRRWLRSLIEHELPDVAVLSYSELPPDARVEQLSPVRVAATAS
jgi:type III secretion protein V